MHSSLYPRYPPLVRCSKAKINLAKEGRQLAKPKANIQGVNTLHPRCRLCQCASASTLTFNLASVASVGGERIEGTLLGSLESEGLGENGEPLPPNPADLGVRPSCEAVWKLLKQRFVGI